MTERQGRGAAQRNAIYIHITGVSLTITPTVTYSGFQPRQNMDFCVQRFFDVIKLSDCQYYKQLVVRMQQEKKYMCKIASFQILVSIMYFLTWKKLWFSWRRILY